MEEKEKEKVYESIGKHGDSFWKEDSNGWNGYLFDEILEMLEKDGLDLKLTKLGTV